MSRKLSPKQYALKYKLRDNEELWIARKLSNKIEICDLFQRLGLWLN